MPTITMSERLWRNDPEIDSRRLPHGFARFVTDVTAAFGVVMLFALLASGMVAFR